LRRWGGGARRRGDELAATYALKAAMTVDEVADRWAPYLTIAESLRIAAGLFRNEIPTSCYA